MEIAIAACTKKPMSNPRTTTKQSPSRETIPKHIKFPFPKTHITGVSHILLLTNLEDTARPAWATSQEGDFWGGILVLGKVLREKGRVLRPLSIQGCYVTQHGASWTIIKICVHDAPRWGETYLMAHAQHDAK